MTSPATSQLPPIYEVDATIEPHGEPVPPMHASGTAVLNVTVTCSLPVVFPEHQYIELNMESTHEGVTTHLNKKGLVIDRVACLDLESAKKTELIATFAFQPEIPAFEDVGL